MTAPQATLRLRVLPAAAGAAMLSPSRAETGMTKRAPKPMLSRYFV